MAQQPIAIKQCDNCGIDVKIFHKDRLFRKNLFCSKKCEGEFRKKQTPKESECPVCHKKFHIKPYQRKNALHNYCSRECFNIAKSEYMKNEGNHQYGLKGELNSSWKGGKRKSVYGYYLIYFPEHPFANGDGMVFEHRLVAEQFLLTETNSVEINGKRYLSPDFVVHHKDGDKTNNDVSNLEIMTLSEHTKYHMSLKAGGCKDAN